MSISLHNEDDSVGVRQPNFFVQQNIERRFSLNDVIVVRIKIQLGKLLGIIIRITNYHYIIII